jgi:hypothetical protein
MKQNQGRAPCLVHLVVQSVDLRAARDEDEGLAALLVAADGTAPQPLLKDNAAIQIGHVALLADLGVRMRQRRMRGNDKLK